MRVAGFGFRKAAGIDSFRSALALTGSDVAALATVDSKLAGLTGLAVELGVPVIGVSVQEMAELDLPGSARVKKFYGTGSVAEASALMAAGPGARLVVSKVKSADGMAVAAIAEGPGR